MSVSALIADPGINLQIVPTTYASDLLNALLGTDNPYTCAGAILPSTAAAYWLSAMGDPNGTFCGAETVGPAYGIAYAAVPFSPRVPTAPLAPFVLGLIDDGSLFAETQENDFPPVRASVRASVLCVGVVLLHRLRWPQNTSRLMRESGRRCAAGSLADRLPVTLPPPLLPPPRAQSRPQCAQQAQEAQIALNAAGIAPALEINDMAGARSRSAVAWRGGINASSLASGAPGACLFPFETTGNRRYLPLPVACCARERKIVTQCRNATTSTCPRPPAGIFVLHGIGLVAAYLIKIALVAHARLRPAAPHPPHASQPHKAPSSGPLMNGGGDSPHPPHHTAAAALAEPKAARLAALLPSALRAGHGAPAAAGANQDHHGGDREGGGLVGAPGGDDESIDSGDSSDSSSDGDGGIVGGGLSRREAKIVRTRVEVMAGQARGGCLGQP